MATLEHDDTAAPAATNKIQSWRDVRELLREDRRRLHEVLLDREARGSIARLMFPAYVCVWLYRWSHHFWLHKHFRLARACWLINVYLTGADISPSAEIGPALFIPHPTGISIQCRAGRRLTLLAGAGIGPARIADDGLPADETPEIGDDVTISYHAGVYGAVRIGDHATICPGCLVDFDVDTAAVIAGSPADVRAATR